MRKTLNYPSRWLGLAAAIALVAISCAPTYGQDGENRIERLQAIGDAFGEEVRSLGVSLNDHAQARSREQERISELQEANVELDRALQDPSSSLANLTKLEEGLSSLRRDVFELTERTAEIRTNMYAHMQRVDELLDEMGRTGLDVVPPGEGLTGTWKLDVAAHEVTGVMSLRQEGSTVRGSYLMSTGAVGSLEGTYAGGKLSIETIDSEEGRTGPSTGTVDPDSGEILGAWLSRDLASGGPSRVEWTARLLTLDDLLE